MALSAEQHSNALQQRLQLFLQVLAQFVASSTPHKRDVGVQCLESLLARQEVRQAVWINSAIIPGLAAHSYLSHFPDISTDRFLDILTHAPGPQMSYQVSFCFWLLTYEQNVAQELNKCAFDACRNNKLSLVIGSTTLFPS